MTENRIKFTGKLKLSLLKRMEDAEQQFTPEWENTVTSLYDQFIATEQLTEKDLGSLIVSVMKRGLELTTDAIVHVAVVNDLLPEDEEPTEEERFQSLRTAPEFKRARQFKNLLARRLFESGDDEFIGSAVMNGEDGYLDDLFGRWSFETMEAYVHFVEGELMTPKRLGNVIQELTPMNFDLSIENIEREARNMSKRKDAPTAPVPVVRPDDAARFKLLLEGLQFHRARLFKMWLGRELYDRNIEPILGRDVIRGNDKDLTMTAGRWSFDVMEAYVHFVDGGVMDRELLTVTLFDMTGGREPLTVENIQSFIDANRAELEVRAAQLRDGASVSTDEKKVELLAGLSEPSKPKPEMEVASEPRVVEPVELAAGLREPFKRKSEREAESVSVEPTPAVEPEPSEDLSIPFEQAEEPEEDVVFFVEPADEVSVPLESTAVVVDEPAEKPEAVVEATDPVEEPAVEEPVPVVPEPVVEAGTGVELEVRLRERLDQHMLTAAGVDTVEELKETRLGDRHNQLVNVFDGLLVPAFGKVDDPVEMGNIYIAEAANTSERQARLLRKELVDAGVLVQIGQRNKAEYFLSKE